MSCKQAIKSKFYRIAQEIELILSLRNNKDIKMQEIRLNFKKMSRIHCSKL